METQTVTRQFRITREQFLSRFPDIDRYPDYIKVTITDETGGIALTIWASDEKAFAQVERNVNRIFGHLEVKHD